MGRVCYHSVHTIDGGREYSSTNLQPMQMSQLYGRTTALYSLTPLASNVFEHGNPLLNQSMIIMKALTRALHVSNDRHTCCYWAYVKTYSILV